MTKANEKYRVIVSQKAADMLTDCAVFIARVSEEAALKFLDEFERQVQSLQRSPLRCPLLRGDYLPENKYRKLLLQNRYLILYQIKDDTVYVDHVLDCRQDYTWLLD